MRAVRRKSPSRYFLHHSRALAFRGEGRFCSRHSSSKRPGNGPFFKAGDPVPETGIYEVVHDRAHRTPHEVVMVPQTEGSFPLCDTCKAKVRYKLVRTAPYIFSDEDFKKSE